VKSIPENTLASFDQALADGCDGFEFDVRRTADGRAVICHNPQFGGIEIAEAGGRQLAALAQLQDVLARYRERAFLDIELKVSGLEEITADLLRQHPPRAFVVSSFLPEVLRAVRRADGAIPLGLICETGAQLRAWRRLPVEYVIPHHSLVRKDLVTELRGAKKNILVWTVNDPGDMKRLAEWGVDGIISDDTTLLCRTLCA